MPELPEVETIRLGLCAQLLGEKIIQVDVLRKESIGFPKANKFAGEIIGRTFKSISRRGKYLLFELDAKKGLVVHLRMSGRLLLVNDQYKESRFLRVRMKLLSGNELHFEDMRVFGRLWLIPSGKSFEEIVPALSELGVEPLSDLTKQHLAKLIKDRSQVIKSLLLDQNKIAGIGNIYADETLFKAGINPLTKAKDLTVKQTDCLVKEIKFVLKQAIKLGGSSIRDYTNSQGINGNYQNESWVYGRYGKPCRQCATTIKRVKIQGRSSHFCPKCQPV